MANKAEQHRKQSKRDAIITRLSELRGNEDIILGLLDEDKLDLLILALGLGAVRLGSEDGQ